MMLFTTGITTDIRDGYTFCPLSGPPGLPSFPIDSEAQILVRFLITVVAFYYLGTLVHLHPALLIPIPLLIGFSFHNIYQG
jgi:hypothetical protein